MVVGVLERCLVAEEVSFYVRQNCLFAKIVTDDGGNVGVDSLVVGNARANGVSQRDIAGAISIQQAGYAQGRVALEGEGVKGIVIDAAGDYRDAPHTAPHAHMDEVVMHKPVASF